ncbi:unnamed protein product, partial [Adineta steineri]
LKPEFFDYEGNLISRKGSTSQSLIESSLKKSTMSSFTISQNPRLRKENDQETFLTELLKRGENEEKCLSLVSTEQTSSINEMMKDNYILKVIDIKTKKSRPNSKSGESRTITLALAQRDISYWNVINQKWTIASGIYTVWISISGNNADIKLQDSFEI